MTYGSVIAWSTCEPKQEHRRPEKKGPPRTSQLRLSQPEAGAVVCPAWGHGHTESHRE